MGDTLSAEEVAVYRWLALNGRPHLVAAVATAPVERAIAEQQTQLRLFRDQFAQLAADYDEGRHGVSTALETIPGSPMCGPR
ncbi:hypothetical protein [Streptomyces sp. Inha503]|uniref:hypothetical protein n=1 Tax=Streptomyces sp. Inha503 TaxID=3383314 RepID=UPI0039A065E6